MDNETKIELLQHLNRLDKAQMKYVYSRLLIQVETEEPVLTEEELEKRTKQAKFMIQEVANELPIVQNKKERHRASLKYYFLKPNSFTI